MEPVKELRRCPFCNGKGFIENAVGEWWVLCNSCGASTAMKSRIDYAIRAWNQRVNYTPARGEPTE